MEHRRTFISKAKGQVRMGAAVAMAARGGGGSSSAGCAWRRRRLSMAADRAAGVAVVLHDAGARAVGGAAAQAKATAAAELNLDGKKGSRDLDRGLKGVKSGRLFFLPSNVPTQCGTSCSLRAGPFKAQKSYGSR
jgi:hypothetical protein